MSCHYWMLIGTSGCVVLYSYRSVLTLIRAKEEDSGNYTMRVDNGNQSRDISLILEIKGQRNQFPMITALTTF